MKTLYHICMTANQEVILRNIDDVRIFTNQLALADFREGAQPLTDSIMSDHLHETLFCTDPWRLSGRQKQSLAQSFNSKYGRRGPLFDNTTYILEIQGPRHISMATNYSLRQGLHHGLTNTPFEYRWSTCNSIFATDRGVTLPEANFTGHRDLRLLFPKNANYPDEWQADSNGILLRKSFEEIQMLEHWYGSARNFIYAMTRKTSQEWLAEQELDNNNQKLILLNDIESGYSKEDIDNMLLKESRPGFYTKQYSDMDLCQIIDSDMLGSSKSIYNVTLERRKQMAQELKHDLGIKSDKQLSRCLVLNYDR